MEQKRTNVKTDLETSGEAPPSSPPPPPRYPSFIPQRTSMQCRPLSNHTVSDEVIGAVFILGVDPPRHRFLPHCTPLLPQRPQQWRSVIKGWGGTPAPPFPSACVDITGRMFGCVCQSVMTELNTGIYSVITALSGQARCGNCLCVC